MPAAHVFVIDGEPVGEFRKSWKRACHKAGLPCVLDLEGKPIKALRTFHDLRRSFARHMDKLHIRQGAIMKLGGWKTDSVFRRYNIVSEGDLRDAIETLNKGNGANKRAKRRGKSSVS
jgi:integrase